MRISLILWFLWAMGPTQPSELDETELLQLLGRLLAPEREGSKRKVSDLSSSDNMRAKVERNEEEAQHPPRSEESSESDSSPDSRSRGRNSRKGKNTDKSPDRDLARMLATGRPRPGEVVVITRKGVPHKVAARLPADLHRTAEESEVLAMQEEKERLQAYEDLRQSRPELPPPNPEDYPLLQLSKATTNSSGPDSEGGKNRERRSVVDTFNQQTNMDAFDTIGLSPKKAEESRRKSAYENLDLRTLISKRAETSRHLPKYVEEGRMLKNPPAADSPESGRQAKESIADGKKRGRTQQQANRRRKRYIEREESKRWTHGIVPYVFSSEIKEDHKPNIWAAMLRVERYTCIRFVPWTQDVAKRYNLDHNGFLRFIRGQGCYSAQGNERNRRGQSISCCGGITCVHELGHALGLAHEHNSPDRDNYTRVNWDNIKKDSQQWYRKDNYENFIVYKYDPSSIMGYGPTVFNVDARPTMDSLEPFMRFGRNFYYYYGEVAMAYDCHSHHCAAFSLECQNDGYVTVENNYCLCRCPPGLDPTTGCTTVQKAFDQHPTTWPSGTYAMLAADFSCPGNAEFQFGSRVHMTEGRSQVGGQAGRFGAQPQGVQLTLNFCVKTGDVPSSQLEGHWTPGKYCIHRYGGACPRGFEAGFVQFDEIRPGSSQGTVPDGFYGANTRYEFCCRGDGFEDDPILVPNTKPFVLYRQTVWQQCQEALGMEAVEDYFVFDNTDQDRVAGFGGSFPRNYEGPGRTFYLFYCYYIPRTTDCGEVIELSATRREATFTSPGFPDNYPNSIQCSWFIKGPEDSHTVLEFLDFEVEAGQNGCPDFVEVRAARLGGVGIKYCGDGLNSTMVSVFHTIMVTMATDNNTPKRGFRAKVHLVMASELCYLESDQGRSYRGDVSVTESGRPCLDWTDVTQCRRHTFDSRDDDYGLEKNYCRNPGPGTRPWCYVQKNGCMREYCDVCGIGRPGNKLEECPDLVAKGHCDKASGRAECPASCNLKVPSPLPATQLTCEPPSEPPDGQPAEPLRGQYKVGEQVPFTCKTGFEVVLRTCLTNGMWSNGGYVCGGCSTGWTSHAGSCYRFFSEALTAAQAQATCRQHHSLLSPAATKDEQELLIQLKEPMTPMWLGLSDELQEGRWLWSDGMPAFNLQWRKGQPDNYYNEDCAVMAPEHADSLLSDQSCNAPTARYSFMCRQPPDTRMVCADRRGDCQTLLSAVPSMCRQYSDFAFTHCPASCMLCRPSTGMARDLEDTERGDAGENCSVPAAPQHGVRLTQEDFITHGDEARYQCDVNYVVTSGNLERACLLSGELTGSAPVCEEVTKVTTPLNAVELVERGLELESGTVLLGGPDFLITRPGKLTRWRLYTRQSRDLALQVWRSRDELPANMLVLVGHTLLTPARDRVVEVALAGNQTIAVEAGDRVGVWAGPGEGGVPFDACQSSSRDQSPPSFRLKLPVPSGQDFLVGHAYEFSSSLECAVFSLSADISPA